MSTQHWRLDSNNFTLASAIARIVPMAIILVGAATAPLSAQVVTIENQGFGTVYRLPANNSIIYTDPIPTSVNSSIIYGSPIPAPVITPPSSFYSYPSYYPNSITRDRRTTLTNPVLVNPTIRDSTLINPTIINLPLRRRDRVTERNQTILRPINH